MDEGLPQNQGVTGASPLATGLSHFGSSPQAVSPVPASIPSADEFENDLQRGYAAWQVGIQFDEYQSAEWKDGWKTGADAAWWESVAAALGGHLHGFSYRYSGSIRFGSEVHSLSGRLLEGVVKLIDASGIAARSDETRSGSAEGKSPAPKGDAQPQSPEPRRTRRI